MTTPEHRPDADDETMTATPVREPAVVADTPRRPDTATRWQPHGFAERIGAALVAPRHALRAADESSDAGKTGSDAAILIALVFVVTHAREIVAAVWIGIAESARVGFSAIIHELSAAVAMDLAFLFCAGVGLTLAAGRTRELGRDFDLACVAFVPFITVKLAASLILHDAPLTAGIEAAVAVAAYGWSGIVLVLAWQQARRRAA